MDLPDVVHTAMKTLANGARQKGLELLWRLDPDVPRQVLGDPHRLRQVLINLAGNAVKFTDQGQIRVVVQLEEEGSQLHFVVCDTGVGIPEDKQALIFEPFRQVDGSPARRYGGTGLGLAICKRFVEMMGDESGWRAGQEAAAGFTSRFLWSAVRRLRPGLSRLPRQVLPRLPDRTRQPHSSHYPFCWRKTMS
jgi:K+-sensing histidine kinase KdpD